MSGRTTGRAPGGSRAAMASSTDESSRSTPGYNREDSSLRRTRPGSRWCSSSGARPHTEEVPRSRQADNGRGTAPAPESLCWRRHTLPSRERRSGPGESPRRSSAARARRLGRSSHVARRRVYPAPRRSSRPRDATERSRTRRNARRRRGTARTLSSPTSTSLRWAALLRECSGGRRCPLVPRGRRWLVVRHAGRLREDGPDDEGGRAPTSKERRCNRQHHRTGGTASSSGAQPPWKVNGTRTGRRLAHDWLFDVRGCVLDDGQRSIAGVGNEPAAKTTLPERRESIELSEVKRGKAPLDARGVPRPGRRLTWARANAGASSRLITTRGCRRSAGEARCGRPVIAAATRWSARAGCECRGGPPSPLRSWLRGRRRSDPAGLR